MNDPEGLPIDNVTITPATNEVEISTQNIIVTVETTPSFRVIFRSKSGTILNEDEPGEGFVTTFQGNKTTIYKKIFPDERFVGLGEALGDLNKRGMGIALNNTDNYKYGDPRIPMYISVPFYIGIHGQEQYGLFFNNTHKAFFNFGSSNNRFASVSFEGGDMDYFFFYDESIAKLLEHYTSTTGRSPLPPKWSLGYHQSRCSYYPQQEVMTLARTFREKSIPVDCIVLDADYLQDYEPFRINTNRFPNMRGMADSLARMNIELTASVNPGIKIDSSYPAHMDGVKKDVFIKYADGSLYEGLMDPSMNNYVDFTSPKGRDWWIDHMKFLDDNGIHGYWNDMNEPAVTGQSIPDNLVFDFDGRKTNTSEAKNVYGMQMARASFEAAQKWGHGKRPFVLTRSAFAGIQRYAAVWSGDNQAKDEYLLSGVLLNCQMGLSGIPFTGPDLGGYIGDGNKELYKRWIEVGMFSAFVRNHREAYANANEPWAYGEEAEAISKSYIEFRYRLMPYIYSTFYEASQTGMPLTRSLCIHYPFDPLVYNNLYQFQYLFGDAFLVVPMTSQDKSKRIYFPPGTWYDLYHDIPIEGGKELEQSFPGYELPLYVKESSIIPMQRKVQSTKESNGDTLYLHVYNGKLKNSFVWYDDDGASLQYQAGDFCKRNIEFDPVNKRLDISAQEGHFKPTYKFIQIILHGFDELSSAPLVNGKQMEVQKSVIPLLDVLGNMDKIYGIEEMRRQRSFQKSNPQKIIIIPYSEKETLLSW